MWQMALPWWEFVVRALVVYVFLILLLRLTGRRQVEQLAPFDLVLVLSNALQNSMNGGDNTITAGLILALTLVGANWLVGYVTYRSKRLTQDELDSALRHAGASCVEDVQFAVLETNGQVSVRLRERAGKAG